MNNLRAKTLYKYNANPEDATSTLSLPLSEAGIPRQSSSSNKVFGLGHYAEMKVKGLYGDPLNDELPFKRMNRYHY